MMPSFSRISFTQCPIWLCQGPRPASARSQPTRLWWPASGLCSPVCCSTTRGLCNGPRMGWHWAWARASKVSGAAQPAQHPCCPIPVSGPLPWTPGLSLLSFLPTGLPSPAGEAQPPFLSPELCLHCFPNPTLCLPSWLWTGSRKVKNGKPERSRETRRPLHKMAADRHTDTRRGAASRLSQSKRRWGPRVLRKLAGLQPANGSRRLALLPAPPPPAQAMSARRPKIHFNISLGTYLFIHTTAFIKHF